MAASPRDPCCAINPKEPLTQAIGREAHAISAMEKR